MMNATPYPFKVTEIGDADGIWTAVGPLETLVVESITNLLPLVKLPKALVFNEIFAVSPFPLLSVGDATA